MTQNILTKESNNIYTILYFQRYYWGGKLKNTFYKITSSKNESYKEKNIIYNVLKFKVVVTTQNQERSRQI